jgi:hypothetical protein
LVESATYGDTGRDGAAERRTDCGVEPSSAPFAAALTALERHCPAYIEADHWQQAVEDGRRFLTQWGEQAAALGWTERDLFGLHEPPAEPHPSYQRLSRRDCIGLVWLLRGAPLVALTADAAAVETADRTSRLIYYRPAATSAVPRLCRATDHDINNREG